MTLLLKTIGYGALLIILSPLIAVALVLLMIYIALDYLILEIVSLPMFFRGKSFRHKDAQTIELEKRIGQRKAYQEMQQAQVSAFQQGLYNPAAQPAPQQPVQNQAAQPTQAAKPSVTDVLPDQNKQGGDNNDKPF